MTPCPFCAEEIQEEAVVCRFCGAVKVNGRWKRNGAGDATEAPGRDGPGFTVRFAGAFFILSAIFEAMALGSGVALFGALREGAVAVGYHLVYIALFLAMGVGLWRGAAWGLAATAVGTVVYTLDKLRYVLDDEAMALELAGTLQGYESLFGAGELEMVLSGLKLTSVVSVLCWWGFLAWLYLSSRSPRGA